ncbi:TIGR02206 family membrane protein [Nesterenkonia muleiensis]|uniref:YwaF family protein n=1 Tax=Nesterenkonia muleiensis TaxID=2282648 RepID=UPI000E731C61|nr:TIGR02206 family membrane protein [Nesterenkonia muleiensis]
MSPVIASVQRPELFGGVHLGTLVVTVLLAILVIWAGRRLRGTDAEAALSRSAGWVLLAASLGWMIWGMLPANWDIEDSLPLHYSDALRFITAVALIRKSQWAVAVCYYWGLTLNTQAMITPHPSQLEVFSVNFVFYWGLHIAVFLGPLWLVWGLGHRPQWKDFFIAFTAALLWAGMVMVVNSVLGTNYAFLNRTPEGASLLDFLGPWPIYVLWLVALTGMVWALMTWPWTSAVRSSPPSADRVDT